jgi:hypothetical protein
MAPLKELETPLKKIFKHNGNIDENDSSQLAVQISINLIGKRRLRR